MIGVYDYTVILTYLSLLSAGCGMVVSLSGTGHPFLGTFFLLFCGLCDAFDGKVAGTKKNRTDTERKFGIQIDSLSDLVAFGVLPACIGAAFIRVSPVLNNVFGDTDGQWYRIALKLFVFGVLILYILTAMIRLAYFNVSEEERQSTEEGARKYYLGLPVTSACLIFPNVALLQYLFEADLTWLYIVVAVITGILFITPFKLKKLSLKGILGLIGIGVLEFIALIIVLIIKSGRII